MIKKVFNHTDNLIKMFIFNHTDGLVRMFISEKISDRRTRWFEVFTIILPIYLEGNKKIKIEIISLYPDDKLLQELEKQYPDKIKVFGFLDKKMKDTPSFIVVEPIGYWMEVLEKEKMIRGFANFGDIEETQKLIECFDKKLKPSTTPRF